MSWPTAVATDQELYVAVNNIGTVLSAGIDNVVTTIPVNTTAGFPADGFITIGAEAIHYTSKDATNFLGATRGSDGTAAAAHSLNDPTLHNVVAAHHNILKEELKAIETDLTARLGANANQIKPQDGSAANPAFSFANDDNTGMYLGGADQVTLVAGGITSLSVLPTYVESHNAHRFQLGSAGAPSMTFITDTDTGIYRGGSNQVTLTAGGATSLSAFSTKIESHRTHQFIDGSAATPGITFSSDPDTGFYRSAADEVAFSGGGVANWFLSNARLAGPVGTIATPTFSCALDQDTGMYFPAADVIGFSAGGVVNWFMASAYLRGPNGTNINPTYGNAIDHNTGMYFPSADIIGFTAGGNANWFLYQDRLTGPDGSAAAPTYTFTSQTNSGLFRLSLNNFGFAIAGTDYYRFNTQGFRPAVAQDNVVSLGQPTARWTAVYAVNGTIQTSHSSTKEDIRPLSDASIDDLDAVAYKRPGDSQEHWGFLIDNLPEEVRYGEDKTGISLETPIAILLKEVKELRKEVNQLKGGN